MNTDYLLQVAEALEKVAEYQDVLEAELREKTSARQDDAVKKLATVLANVSGEPMSDSILAVAQNLPLDLAEKLAHALDQQKLAAVQRLGGPGDGPSGFSADGGNDPEAAFTRFLVSGS